MSSYDYLQSAIKSVEEKLEKSNRKLAKKAPTPLSSGYRPELDGTEELNADETQYYQELIGILRWATEIGRVDIVHEVSIMSSYQANPREGHMEEVLHMFAFLKNKPKLSLYFDHAEPQLDPSMFNNDIAPFKEHYRDTEEEYLFNQPQPRGRAVTTTAYGDTSHVSDKVIR